MILQSAERQVFVNVLAHHVGGLNTEGDAGDHAEGAETDNGAVECFAVVGARELQDVAGRGDDFERGYGGGEIAILLAGAVSGRHTCADD